jgi:hypothetical protein
MAVPVMTADRSDPNGPEMDIPVASSSPLPKLGKSIENKFHRAVTKNTSLVALMIGSVGRHS